jgi:putative membrane protein
VVGHVFALIAFLVFVLFWVGVIALGVLVAMRFVRPRTNDKALAILNELFARGEIDQAEYEKRKAVLSR